MISVAFPTNIIKIINIILIIQIIFVQIKNTVKFLKGDYHAPF